MNEFYIASFAISLVLTFLILPYVIRFSLNKGYIDEPDERKIHSQVVPRIGGVVFLPVSIIAVAIVAMVGPMLSPALNFNCRYDIILQVLAVMIIFAVGACDDFVGLRYRTKFIAQFVAGILICASGAYINNFHGVIGIYEIPPALGWAITIFAVIYCTNAINFIDGVDGQASAIGLTALLYYAWHMWDASPLYTIFAVALAGALIAFMRYNILGKPESKSKTFMGDTGSLYLGLVMVLMGVIMCNGSYIDKGDTDNTFILAFAPLFMPCMDVVRVVLHRVKFGANPFAPDQNHIHHKFLVLGFSHHKVSLIVATLNILVIAVSYLLAMCVNANLVIVILLVLWTLFNMYITHLNIEKTKTYHNENL